MVSLLKGTNTKKGTLIAQSYVYLAIKDHEGSEPGYSDGARSAAASSGSWVAADAGNSARLLDCQLKDKHGFGNRV